MYHKGDIVKYKTSKWRFMNGQESGGETKTSIVEERFCTMDGSTCYWMERERQLIFGSQILGKC